MLGSPRIELTSPLSADAQLCLGRYFAELAQRFEGGFDLSQGGGDGDPAMAPPHGAFVVARLDGKAVGCGGFKRLDDHAAEIKRVWCGSEVRGRGVATALMNRLETLAREAGYSIVRLDTNRALVEAHAFYRKLGYHATERYNDNPYAHHWFEKAL